MLNYLSNAPLVDVYERNLEHASTIIDVTSMDDLAKLAERQGTMILHMVLNFLHYYLVENNGTTYRYVVSAEKKGSTANDAVHIDLPKNTANAEEHKLPATGPVHFKTPRHWMTVSKKNRDISKSITNEVLNPAVNYYENNFSEEKQPILTEVPEYVIHNGEIEFAISPPEAEILRKIRL
jgi:hypothetical protein